MLKRDELLDSCLRFLMALGDLSAHRAGPRVEHDRRELIRQLRVEVYGRRAEDARDGV